jgi:hypothetical protein
MAFEEFRIQLAMLMDEIARNPSDAHQLQESLREKIAEMRGLGLPVPDDLVGLEEYLEDDLERSARLGRAGGAEAGEPDAVTPPGTPPRR